MSPEQVRGLPIDHRSDIFAVGTCMYEMLTSERLFLGESDFSTLERVRNADVPPVSTVVTDLPAEMDRIVMRALAREPADRWQTAGELQEALLAFVARDRPPFGTSKLSSWMKTAFAQEMAREKQRLEAYAAVGRPHVVAGPRRDAAIAPAPRPVAAPAPPAAASTDELSLTDVGEASSADLAGEATVLTASPFDEPPRAAGVVADDVPGDLADQPTQIFFSADDLEEIEEEGAPAAAPPSHAQVPLARPAAVPRPSHPSVRPTAQPATLASPGPLQAVPSIQIAPDLVAPPAPASPAVRPPDASAATGLGRSFALAALAAFVLLLAGAGVAYLIFGREQTGVVEIRTVPDVGATVLLDGIPRGNAPLRIERVAAGQHALEVRAEGFVAVRRVVDVGSDSTIMLDVVLERQPPMFAADFGGTRLPEPPALPSAAPTSSAPATASAPPAIEPGPPTAPSGSSSPSEERQAGSDSLAPHGPQRATAPSPGTVRAREPDSPSSAVASPRPSASGASTPAAGTPPRGPTPFASTSGSVGRPGARTEPAPDPAGATPAPQRPTSESATEARGYGTLVINTIPWARVFIDGRDTRRNTPIPELRVRAGTRRVGLQTPDGRMHEIEVEVPANETVRITRRL
ncbi:MAG: PEGA domain-containing protein, partial [Myxococcales bacterium]|nr:PEGA domain-containing protein [Myxococcales bacterium]